MAEAMRRWIVHVLGVEVAIDPLTEMRDVSVVDADATRISDLLLHGEDLDETTMWQMIGLFKLTFRDPSVVLDKVKGEPIYLILAMMPDMILMKPQKLVTGLPIRHLEAII